jgi:hypothetical protein
LQLDVRRRQRLLRGERLLAAWTVSADTWSQFVSLQKTRTDKSQDRVHVGDHRGSTGIQIMISEVSVLVDDDFHHLSDLREVVWHETVPPYFDFRSTTYTGSQWETWHLRIPAAIDDPAAMRRVWALLPSAPRRTNMGITRAAPSVPAQCVRGADSARHRCGDSREGVPR